MTGKESSRRRRIFLRIGAAPLLLLLGCRTSSVPPSALSLSVTVPALTFLKSPLGSNADFPTLEVFDSQGEMVYLGQVGSSNVTTLKSLPDSVAGLHVLPGKLTLAQITDKLPGLQDDKRNKLLHSHLPTAVSISLEECHACTIQNEALGEEAKKSLLSRGVNLVLIQVSLPHRGGTG